jgi:carboxypeptidase Q
VDEEVGGLGAQQYGIDYASTFPQTSFVMESDTGAFGIYGLSVTANTNAIAQLQALAPLFAPLGSAVNITAGGDDTDEAVLCSKGVPCAALWPYDPRTTIPGQPAAGNNPCAPFAGAGAPAMPFSVSDGYMWLHHTEADTVDKLDPRQLDVVAATNAIWALSVANLPSMLPRA